MGLFSFFKPKLKPQAVKTEIKYDDALKALQAGILFEDNGEFLPWDMPIEESKLYQKKGYRADRTIYEWGDRTILKGLALPLSTILWKQKDDGSDVPSIEFSVLNEDANKYFQIISAHLETLFGVPKIYNDDQGKLLEWKAGVVKLKLNLFEQYHTDKLVFQVGRL